VEASKEHPVLIDKYIMGKEVEVDGISDGQGVLIPGIMEHIERAGVHSGDSMAVYPPISLSKEIQGVIVDYTTRLAKALRIKGLFNIQFVIDEDNKVHIIEVNPRASRTVPILTKVTGIPMVKLATDIILGNNLESMGYSSGLAAESSLVAVKVPVFSFSKLTMVDTFLGPEMKSTGEVMGVDKNAGKALYKALLASGIKVSKEGNVLLSIAERDRDESVQLSKRLKNLGYQLFATEKTYSYLKESDIEVTLIPMKEVGQRIRDNKLHMIINKPTKGKVSSREGFLLRRTAMEYNVPCITSLDTINAIIKALNSTKVESEVAIYSLDQY
jgi:carbamoyl-phosphate synthase large subunit